MARVFELTLYGGEWVRNRPKEFRASEVQAVRSIDSECGGGAYVTTQQGTFRVTESVATIERRMEGMDH